MSGAVRSNAARAGGRAARLRARESGPATPAVQAGIPGGRYQPLTDYDIQRIHHTALDVLENIGMATPIPMLVENALARGCWLTDSGRLCFPRALVEDVIAAAPREMVLHGRAPGHDLELGGTRVHFAGGGEAVSVLDWHTRRFRPSTIEDVYDFARLVDRLEHVHAYSRFVVATEIEDPLASDLSTAYASLAGTAKHTALSFIDAAHVDPTHALLDMIAGGDGAFARRPFCHGGGCPVVSPLTYGADNAEVCVAVPRMGCPVWVVIAPQAGATAPAALAGTLVQSTAETLAALLLVNLVHPGHPVIFSSWPFVSDLRTGAFSGGGGEEAVLNAASAQISNWYGLVSSVGAGMTDAKLPDNQAGFEKGITTVLAALAGANSISEMAGMLASLMGCSYEAMVIDNDMLGCVLRVLRGVEVTDETLSYETIREVAEGAGHFLGHPQTLALMESEYLYPRIADRSAPGVWEEAGNRDVGELAHARAKELLADHYPEYIDPGLDARIRERFPIVLPREAMRSGCGRW